MVCFSAYYYYSAKDYVKETLSEVTYMQRYAAMGTREEVILPDGSKVWLNAGTLLVYPSSFISESRNVYIAGEGFFEVSKDKEHPLLSLPIIRVGSAWYDIQYFGVSGQ